MMARLLRDPFVPGDLGYGWRSLLHRDDRHDPSDRSSAAVVERGRALGGGLGTAAATTADARRAQPPMSRITPLPLPRTTRTTRPMPVSSTPTHGRTGT